MNSEKLKSPLELNDIENNAISKIGSSLSGCIRALEAMRGNMVQHLTIDDESIWRFKHPTIGDAFAKHIVNSPDMVEIYLHGSSVDQLLEHITCGDIGLTNAIIIPKKLFPLILDRLNSYKSSKKYKTEFLSEWGAKRSLFNFLARRCTPNFLKLYIENSPEVLEQITTPSKFLEYSPEVNLAIMLHSNDLLPNENRKAFISKVSEYAISGENLYVLSSDDLKEMFVDNEYEELLLRIQNELIPKISELKETWKTRFDKDEDASYHMSSLKENLEAIEYEFSNQPSIVFEVNKELMEIEKWITENTVEEPASEMENLSGETEEQEEIERSIFDDIDM